jgi:predicted outer membrane repeat protein
MLAFGFLNSSVGTRRAGAFSILTVTTTADSGAGSLRDAVGSTAPGDIIMFSLTPPATISLTSGQIDIGSSIAIIGPGANLLTVSGSNLSRIFSVAGTATVTIAGLTIANGTDIVDDLGGGGLVSGGTLTVTNCAFNNNQALGGGGAILSGSGKLFVSNCTFSLNSTTGFGGAISNVGGTLSATNCTFGNNTAGVGGGGIETESASANSVTNCTFNFNGVASSGGNGSAGSGGGILIGHSTTLALRNTIIAGSVGGDCANKGSITTNSHNLIQDGSCSPLLSGNPNLGPLQNNGGPTQTFALLAGSPAIDAGDDSVLGPPLGLTTDQRGQGFPRKVIAHVDIGAFESQSPAGPVFDACLKDNITGNLLQWNSTTGQYKFTRCSDGFMLTGTSTVALVNGIRTLKDFKTDRRISAGFNTGQLTGNATIYLQVAQGVWQTFRIIDTNPSAACKC